MNFLEDIKYSLLPELIISILVIINCILCVLPIKKYPKIIFTFNFLALSFALASLSYSAVKIYYSAFYNSFLADNISTTFRLIVLFASLIVLLMSEKPLKLYSEYKTEFYVIFMTAVLGSLLLCGANDLVLIFVALETLSIPSYILSGFSKSDMFSNEASLKYFVVGAVASAILLYGMSLIYGITGSTNLTEISHIIFSSQNSLVMVLSMLFMLTGIFFKLSSFPFHVWAPDVYTGAPVQVAAFLSVVSKTAGFALLLKILTNIFGANLFSGIIIAIVSVITMFIGNLGALTQTDLRRLMAYSSVAQAGYILAGFAVLSKLGASASIFYIFSYLFMNIGVWAAIEIFINKTGKSTIEDLNGLGYMNPFIAISMTICLVSLAGLPLTAGFWAKFYLFKSVFFAGIYYLPLLIFALINTVLGLYYYTKIIKAMYVNPLNRDYLKHNVLDKSLLLNTALLICVTAVIFIGLSPSAFIKYSQNTILSSTNPSEQSFHKLNFKKQVYTPTTMSVPTDPQH